jgi:serine/threonine protein kinase
MNDYPDFSSHGYQIVGANGRNPVLGHNSIGGRVTYLAVNTKTQQPVVIKQFQFAQLGAKWGEYDAIEQEIKVLRRLKHPSIPRYLDFFQTASGFCMVQEYKDAESAAKSRSFSPQEIKQVAISVLEILVYLQSMKPPVIHRDIKPENILIDGKMKVYLVDFGFARMGGGEVAASSVVKGSLGFMPPEQLFNRQLTEASDLYGLGATLICLLTGTKSADIGNLIDERYGIHFQHLVPPQERGWLNWLEKMVEPRPQDRYANAAEALAALKPLDVSRLPKVRLSLDKVEFTAVELGDKVTELITVSNPIPETVLAGRWEVAPHASDPPHTPYDHAWISFEPVKFEGNQAVCEITVDTSQLLAVQTYTRQVLLRTNSQPDTYPIAIEVKTAPLPKLKRTPYLSQGSLAFMSLFIYAGWLLGSRWDNELVLTALWGIAAAGIAVFATVEKTMMAEVEGIEAKPFQTVTMAGFGALIGATLASVAETWMVPNPIGFSMVAIGLVMGTLVGALAPDIKKNYHTATRVLTGCAVAVMLLVAVAIKNTVALFTIAFIYIVGYPIALLCWMPLLALVSAKMPDMLRRGYYKKDAVIIALLTAGFCISLGAGLQLSLNIQQAHLNGWVEPLELATVAGTAIAGLSATAIPLLDLILFKRDRIIVKYYNNNNPFLIKP